jgi:hypothetical protein
MNIFRRDFSESEEFIYICRKEESRATGILSIFLWTDTEFNQGKFRRIENVRSNIFDTGRVEQTQEGAGTFNEC